MTRPHDQEPTVTMDASMPTLRFAAATILAACLATSPAQAIGEDCNGNGMPDAQDIANGTSLDCDGDGIPDECMPCLDPDGNGLLDPCERDLENGVVAQYFRSDEGYGNFSQRVAVRVESSINTNFGNLPAGVPQDDFCVRFTGLIVPPATGTYSIRTSTDDGARLWIDGVLLIDEWRLGGFVNGNADVDLVAGVPVRFRMDYFDHDGGQNATLMWSPPDYPYQTIPASAYRAFADADGDGWSDLASDCDGDGVVDAQAILEGVADCDGNCVPDECEILGAAPAAYWRFEQAGTTVIDSGPFGLDGMSAGAILNGKIPVSVVPRTGAVNTLSRTFTQGRVVVDDPAGDLSFGEAGFTIEAWVRPTNVGGAAREMFVQRKRLDDPDTNLEYAVYLRAGNLPSNTGEVFGKTSGFNGREIAVRFGNGRDGDWSVISSLEVPAGVWSHVSVAFGPSETGALARFGVNGVFETVELPLRERTLRAAPVVLCSHTNASGAFNQPFNGGVDELRMSHGVLDVRQLLDDPAGPDCNGNGILDACDAAAGSAGDCDGNGVLDDCEVDCNSNGIADVCEILAGLGEDCDGNGLLDACDIAAGAGDCDDDGRLDLCQIEQEDCNGNGIVDACDVAAGAEDCDGNLIPDLCERGGELELAYDDGISEYGVRSNGSYMAWLNAFPIEPFADTVVAIELMIEAIDSFHPIDVYVWADYDSDGNPADAHPLWTTSILGGPTGTIRRIEVPNVVAGLPGGKFFVGCVLAVDDSMFPAALDISGTAVPNRSWIVGSQFPIDPSNLAAGAIEYGPIEQALFPGNWILRAVMQSVEGDCNQNGVLDVCDIAAGKELDLDGNGVPDACEDCNANGVPDGLDIAAGTSVDCQLDGIPDECQGPLSDCDGDGVPDACELAQNDCNGNEVPDHCDIDSGFSLDFDGNGVPDECEDCNGNGELDSLDILFGDSADCDGDGVPDECQFGDPETPYRYIADDGTRESNVNVIGAYSVAWMQRFEVLTGREWIGAVEVMWGNTYPGLPAQAVVWSDPNQDGVPDDAQVISIANTTTVSPNTNTLVRVAVPPVHVGPPGTRFFIGALVPNVQGTAPTAIDVDTQGDRFWIAASVAVELDPNDLGAGFLSQFPYYSGIVRGMAFDGALPGDCNANGIIDICDILDGFENDANGNGIPDSCEPCPADLDGDGLVGPGDLTIVLASWSVGGGCGSCAGDLDGDGVVDAGDLTEVLAAWGPCWP